MNIYKPYIFTSFHKIIYVFNYAALLSAQRNGLYGSYAFIET